MEEGYLFWNTSTSRLTQNFSVLVLLMCDNVVSFEFVKDRVRLHPQLPFLIIVILH